MKQVLVIPGGSSFGSYEDYLRYLRERPIDLDFGSKKDWKASLSERLGSGYQVILPRMPNRDNARYEEWKLWFKRHIELLEDGVILIGHSLGGSFLAKYLSKENIAKRVRATLLVAAPCDTFRLDSVEFLAEDSLERFAKQGGAIHLYFSTDDPVIPYSELKKYQDKLPGAVSHTFDDRGHFNQEEFPELVADILSL